MTLSKRYLNCAYVTVGNSSFRHLSDLMFVTDREKGRKFCGVCMVDYKAGKVVKKFSHNFYGMCHFWSFASVYINEHDTEILVSGVDTSIYFFDTETTKIIKKIATKKNVTYSRIFKNRFLFATSHSSLFARARSVLSIIDLKTGKNLCGKTIHNGKINDLCCTGTKDGCARLVTASSDTAALIVRVEHESFHECISQLDFLERLKYLNSKFLTEEEEMEDSSFVIRFIVFGSKELIVFKFLLLGW